MKRAKYEKTLSKLQVRLCHLQRWVKEKGLRVIVIFEGRDGAGKGGTIRALTERVSPRVFRVVALPAPSDREKSQMYMQRYMQHFPAAGEVVIFDRSWYNRAGVEYVMGFCTPKQHERFLELCPQIEKLHRRGRHHPDQALAGSEQRRTAAALRGARRRSAPAVEAEPDGPAVAEALVRLLARARHHAEEDRHEARAVVHRAIRRQADRAAQHDRASARRRFHTRSCRSEGQAAKALDEGQVRRQRVDRAATVRSRAVLSHGAWSRQGVEAARPASDSRDQHSHRSRRGVDRTGAARQPVLPPGKAPATCDAQRLVHGARLYRARSAARRLHPHRRGDRERARDEGRRVPVRRIPDRPPSRQLSSLARYPAGGRDRARARRPEASGAARSGRRTRAREWRSRPPRGLLHGLDGHPQRAGHRLRHPVRVRDLRSGNSRRVAGRADRPMVAARQSLGDRAPGDLVRCRPGRADRGARGRPGPLPRAVDPRAGRQRRGLRHPGARLSRPDDESAAALEGGSA